jgi:hypothetical protein
MFTRLVLFASETLVRDFPEREERRALKRALKRTWPKRAFCGPAPPGVETFFALFTE